MILQKTVKMIQDSLVGMPKQINISDHQKGDLAAEDTQITLHQHSNG